MCGIFGIDGCDDASNLTYLGLYALQHRGQESAGIASVSLNPVRSEANIGTSVGSSGAGEQIIAPGHYQPVSEGVRHRCVQHPSGRSGNGA